MSNNPLEFKDANKKPVEEEVDNDLELEDESLDVEEEIEEVKEEKPVKRGRGKGKKVKEESEDEDASEESDQEKLVKADRDNKMGTLGDLIVERFHAPGTKADNQRVYFASEEKVKTIIPLSPSEKRDAKARYQVNGFAFYVRKGQFQMIPKSVADMISETYGYDARVEAEHPLNLQNADESKRNVLGL